MSSVKTEDTPKSPPFYIIKFKETQIFAKYTHVFDNQKTTLNESLSLYYYLY